MLYQYRLLDPSPPVQNSHQTRFFVDRHRFLVQPTAPVISSMNLITTTTTNNNCNNNNNNNNTSTSTNGVTGTRAFKARAPVGSSG